MHRSNHLTLQPLRLLANHYKLGLAKLGILGAWGWLETRALDSLPNSSYRQSDTSLRIVPGLISLASTGTASRTTLCNHNPKPHRVAVNTAAGLHRHRTTRQAFRSQRSFIRCCSELELHSESCREHHIKRRAFRVEERFTRHWSA